MSKKFLFLSFVLLFATSRQTKAISLIEAVIIAGGSTAIAYLNNKRTNLDEKINLILDVEKHFSREFEDIMHRERTKQFAAKYEKTTYLQEIIENKYSHLKHWVNYLIYEHFTRMSPLVKVRIIKDVWWFEMMFFGEHKTTLTQRENEVAEHMYKQLQNKYSKDEFDEKNYQ